MAESENQRETGIRQLIEVDNELMEDILEIVRSRSDFLLLNILRDLYSSDIAHIMNRLEVEEAEYVFGILPSDTGSEVLLELDESYREHLLKTISQPKLTELVDNMDSDDAADILGELPEETAEKLLETMDVEDSSHVEELLRYDESTAGGLMAKEFAAVHPKDTVKQAIRVVRKMAKEHKNIYNIYVVDDIGTLLGSVGLQDLLLPGSPALCSEQTDPETDDGRCPECHDGGRSGRSCPVVPKVRRRGAAGDRQGRKTARTDHGG